MKSIEEVEKLKKDWLQDPIWDIESTEGFEEHKEELTAFHDQMREKWKADRIARLSEFAEKIGIKDNLVLAKHIQSLEYQIERLERQIELLNQ